MLASELQIVSVATDFGMLPVLFVAVIRKLSSKPKYLVPTALYYRCMSCQTMVPLSFFLFVGGLVLLVLVFSFYIFPYVICQSIPEIEQLDDKDPIRGFCSVFR